MSMILKEKYEIIVSVIADIPMDSAIVDLLLGV